VSLFRLTPGHVVAGVAALALLLAMALDWYSTDFGEEARRIEELQGDPVPGAGGDVEREVAESASIEAEEEERNAWQASGVVDRIVLALLVGSVVFGLAAAALRAADRSYPPPLTPSLLAAGFGAAGALLVAIRIIDVGAAEAGGAVEAGAPLGLIAVGALALGAALASRSEREPDRGSGATA
jgi:hypothetical protein